MVVQLLLQGMKPVRFRDAVKLQLAWEEGDSDSPSKLMTIMNASWISSRSRRKFSGFVLIIRSRISRKTKDRARTLDEWGRRRLVKEMEAKHV